MKKKQFVGIIIAAVLFIAVGISGVASAVLLNSSTASTMQSLFTDLQGGAPMGDYYAVIDVVGTIQNATADPYGFTQLSYYHVPTLNYIKGLKDDESNKGLFLYINSPGGGVYESDELYACIMDYKEQTGRPVYAYMANYAASGGYYVSVAADTIKANRNTTTGSIGVILSYTNVRELYEKLGLKTVVIASGKNKAMGTADIDLTDEQLSIYQSVVDEAYAQFVSVIAAGRTNLTTQRIKELADGRIYTAQQAFSNGLIDGITDYDSAIAEFDEITGAEAYTPNLVAQSVFGSIFAKIDALKTSDAEIFSALADTSGNGVPMYYAQLG